MVKRLVYFALNQKLFLCMLVLLFVAGGVVAFNSLPIEAFPDVSDVQVTVITLFNGHAPEEIEKQITVPLEIELSGLPHCVRMFSHNQFGLSFIILTFDDQVTDYFARQQVLERLEGAELPPGVKPELAPLSTAIGEIYRYTLKSTAENPTELRSLQDWVVTRHLKRLPGVADVVSFGGLVKQYEVSVDLGKMKSYNVTLQQVLAALGRGNSNAGGSYIEQGEQIYLIRGIGLLRAADDIGKVVLAQRNGVPILIRDIASIKISCVPRQGVIGQDGDDDVTMGIVLMRKGENPARVLDGVEKEVIALNESVLPKTVKLVPFYNRRTLMDATMHTVRDNLLHGAILVALVLWLFLFNVRAALIVALLIPLSLLSTFIGLTIRGIPANLLSLGAMDFGIIVDGAVIVVENVIRKISEHHRKEDAEGFKNLILEATVEVGRPTLFSMMIIIIAYIPIFTLQRQEGRIFAPMAYTVVSALVGSLIFSLTLVPLLCFFSLRWRVSEKENPIIRLFKFFYRPTLKYALRLRWLVLGASIAAFAGSLMLVPQLGTEFLPELDEGTLWINVTLAPGTSLSESSKQASRIREIIKSFPEVRTVISQAGRPEDGTDAKTSNNVEFFGDLKPRHEWSLDITKEQLITQMEEKLTKIPGVHPGFSQPIRDNVLESISQIKGQIVIKIFGEDTKVIGDKADEMLRIISEIRGVARAAIDRHGQSPQLQITIDRDHAARYGLNVADVGDVIETALGGKSGTEIWEGEKKFDVVVRLDESQRRDEAAIRKVLVVTPDGLPLPLEQVADIAVKDGSINISRESGMRVVALSVFIRDRDMGGLVDEMKSKLRPIELSLPAGYYVTWGGEFENQQRAMARLQVIVPVSIFLIFVLLFDAFKSVREALLILLNVPLALIGGILLLYITGIHLSVSAAIGFIALFGQAVLNGVVMISYFKQLRGEGMALRDAVITGSLVRLRTVLMTALLAMLGLLPMALSHEIGAEVQRPLAVVVIGGLVSATLLTLVVLPVIYYMMQQRSERMALSEAI